MRIDTVNLLLRPWKEADAEALYKFTNDGSAVSGFVRAPHESVDVSRQVIAQILSMPDSNALTLRQDGRVVGGIAMFACRLPEHRADPELTGWTGLAYKNHPLLSEAMDAMLDYCFDWHGCAAVWFSRLSDDTITEPVETNCGFTFDSEVQTGPERREKFYRITREQWEKNRDKQKRLAEAIAY